MSGNIIPPTFWLYRNLLYFSFQGKKKLRHKLKTFKSCESHAVASYSNERLSVAQQCNFSWLQQSLLRIIVQLLYAHTGTPVVRVFLNKCHLKTTSLWALHSIDDTFMYMQDVNCVWLTALLHLSHAVSMEKKWVSPANSSGASSYGCTTDVP